MVFFVSDVVGLRRRMWMVLSCVCVSVSVLVCGAREKRFALDVSSIYSFIG